jgi:hypothetical protein
MYIVNSNSELVMKCRSSVPLVLKKVLSDKISPKYTDIKISWNKTSKTACMDVKCGR